MRDGLRDAVARTMDRLQLDALIYPTWSNPPRLIGDLNTPAGDNSQVFSPTTGMPAITVPMGYTRNNALPAGMTFFGRAFDEETIDQARVRLRASDEVAARTRVDAAAALTIEWIVLGPWPRPRSVPGPWSLVPGRRT